jgi:hypothetical protein
MRALLLAVLVLAGAAPTVLAFGWGTVGYDVLILERQLEDCPPRGEHPFGGCDQCLAYRYQPLLFLSRVFCGEPGTDWCPIRWEDCDICNGSCAVLWTSGEKKWINVIGDMANVHDTITECRQWQTQIYGTSRTGEPIPGAYFFGDSFGSLPPHRDDYRSLAQDPNYLGELAAYSGGSPDGLEASWRHRMGLFAVMAQSVGLGPLHDHYERAASLCAWQYVIRFVPADERERVLAAMSLPRSLTGLEWSDLEQIFEVTCNERPFRDCWDAVTPSTWGGIKHLYREP